MLPDQLEIEPLRTPPHATIRVPGSKSITNRALELAALSSRHADCHLNGILRSEDTEVMIESLRRLAFRIETNWNDLSCVVHSNSMLPVAADLHVANSGTTMRFLTALVSLGQGRYRLDGVPRMRERPIQDLLDVLNQLGVHAYSENNNGYPPVIVETNGLRGGTVRMKGDISSQFLSAVLMVAPLATEDVMIDVDGPLVSEPYVAMTVAMMRQFGGVVNELPSRRFHIPGRQIYRCGEYAIEPDASAASYFFAAAAIMGGSVTVPGLTKQSLQGDVRFVEALERMGCRVVWEQDGIMVHSGPLCGIDIDMNAISDTVMTLAAVACFAKEPTTIRNVAHIRHKETDRLAALAAELRRVGAEVEESTDGLTIHPAPLHGASIDTYNDHRMAMSMALIGLRVPGIIIRNPACVGKTYPDFFADLDRLRSK